jgi:deoxyribodipyrimidine photo-lyase
MIQSERIIALNAKEAENRDYVLYWMQASQRTEYNHALECAILRANALRARMKIIVMASDKNIRKWQMHRLLF